MREVGTRGAHKGVEVGPKLISAVGSHTGLVNCMELLIRKTRNSIFSVETVVV